MCPSLRHMHKDDRWAQSLRVMTFEKKIWSICAVIVCILVFSIKNLRGEKKTTGELEMKHALMHVHRCTQWCCSFLSISLRILLKIHSFFFLTVFMCFVFLKFNDQISSVFSVISPSKSMPHHFAVTTDSLICFTTIRCWYEIQYFSAQTFTILHTYFSF